MLTKLPKSFKPPAPSSGFTLIELLASVAISVVIFSLAGWASANLLQNKYKTSADSEVRNNLNRTTEFISDEVRQARRIINDETLIITERVLESGAVEKIIPGYDAATDQLVLALEHPDFGPDRQIIYYTTPPRNEWEIGSRVLRRWGPPLDNNGNYIISDDWNDWEDAPIVDRLASKEDVADNLARCLTTSLFPVPFDADKEDGFSVCVSGEEDIVRLRLNAQVNLTSRTGGQKDKVIYTADTQSFARAAAPTSPEDPPADFGAYPQPDTDEPDLPFRVYSNQLSLEIIKNAEFRANYPSNTDCASCTVIIGDRSYDLSKLSSSDLMVATNTNQVDLFVLEVLVDGKKYSTIDGNNNTLGQSVKFYDYYYNDTNYRVDNNEVLLVFTVKGQEFLILFEFRDA